MPKKRSKGPGRRALLPSKGSHPEVAVEPAGSIAKCEDLSELCRNLISGLISLFPKVHCSKPIPPGGVAPELKFDARAVQRLFVAAAMDGDSQGLLVWDNGDCELLVNTGKVRVDLEDGLIIVNIPVSCDQTGDITVQVPFAVGGKQRPAGMVIATEERPRGPAQIIDVWGESLTAFAWRTLLSITTRIAFNHGVDQDREGLLPAALTASRDGLSLVAMARHSFDRVIK